MGPYLPGSATSTDFKFESEKFNIALYEPGRKAETR